MREAGRPPAADCNLLWAASGGICAFPQCEQALVERPGGRWVTQGEIAHIHAHSPEGPRYDRTMTQVERDSYGNTLLLCRRHHRIVDADYQAYPAANLSTWKKAHEAVYLSKALAAVAPTCSSLVAPPYPEGYVQRPTLVAAIRDCMRGGAVALTGISGAGKTVTATELFEAVVDVNYRFWLRGLDEFTLLTDLAAIGDYLGLSTPQQVDEQSVRLVTQALEAREDWFMVIDDVRDYRMLRHIPRGSGLVLVTTQSAVVPGFTAYPVQGLTQDQSETILKTSAILGAAPPVTLHAMAGLCHGLPIAVAQVAAFSSATLIPPQVHLEMLAARRGELLARGELTQHDTFVASLQLALERLSVDARDLLATMSVLADAPVPIYAPVDPICEIGVFKDALRLEDAVGELRKFSLVTRSDAGLSLHSLVREIVRHLLDVSAAHNYCAIFAVGAQIPEWTHRADNWRLMEGLEPHLAAILREQAAIHPELTGLIANKLGPYLGARGRQAEARAILEDALRALGDSPEQDGIRGSLQQNLANVLADQGDLAAAEAMMRSSLEAKVAAYGPTSRSTALAHAGLGNMLHSHGRLNEARAQHEQALAAYRLMNDAMLTADALNDIASTYVDDHEAADRLLAEAQTLVEEFDDAWEIYSQTLSLRARVEEERGNVPAAIEYAVSSRKVAQAAAEVSPVLARALGTHGRLLCTLGLSRSGVKLMQRAYDMLVETGDSDSPNCAALRGNLGFWGLADEMPSDVALEHLRVSLHIFEQRLPQDHESVLLARQMLARAEAMTALRGSADR